MEIFTLDQWRARGLSRDALRRAMRDGRVRRMTRGVYATCEVPDTVETRARAVALVCPHGLVVCRETSSWLSGIDVLPPGAEIADEPIHIVGPTDLKAPRRQGCRPYQADLPADDLVEEFGIVRTRDLRTALDLGRFRPRPRAVAALDAFLNRKRVDLPSLWERAQPLVKCRNCRRLRANLSVADGGAQSPAESEQRVLFVDAGLPRPETQIPVYDASGRLRFLDMGWKQYRVGSEFDGEEYHDDAEQKEHDATRRGLIERVDDWFVDVARKGDLWGQPAALVARTAELLLARGWTPPDDRILEQISRATAYEASSGRRWDWMPLDKLLAN